MMHAEPTQHYRKFFARLVKWAMTREQALETLGFAPGMTPSEDEVRRAQRKKMVELGHEHGGDPKAITEANVASEILRGNYRAENDYRYNRSEPEPESSTGWPTPRPRPPEPERDVITFEQAKAKAGVPGDVEWLFVTTRQVGQGSYSGDESSQRKEGWVAFGQTASKYIFVGVQHSTYSAFFIGGGNGHDITSIRTYEYAKDSNVTPSWLYGNVVRALKDMKDMHVHFNSKVRDARGQEFSEVMPAKGVGGDKSIKHIMVDLGLVDGDDASVAGRKQVVEARLERDFGSFGNGDDKPKPNYYPEPKGTHMWYDGGYHGSYYRLMLILNGKEFPLGQADWDTFCKLKVGGKKLKDLIFGQYEERKNLTRMPKAKASVILGGMAEHFKELPADALAVLVKAAEQTKAS